MTHMNRRSPLVIVAAVVIAMFSSPSAQAVSASDFKPGATISGVVLNGLDLSGKDLRGITLNKVTLKNVNFTRANLSGATVTASTLDGADFSYATLNNANFTGAKIPAGRFKYINATGLSLKKCQCNYAMFTSFTLAQGSLAGASLKLATMQGARFTGTDFTGAQLLDVQASHADFVLTNFAGALLGGSEFTKSTFAKVNLKNAVFGASSFATTRWTAVTLTGANASQASFRGVEATGIVGKPILNRSVKLISGVFHMAPAKPLFTTIKRVNGRSFVYLKEVLQTGAPGSVKYRFSTDQHDWSAWTEALGKRTYDDFSYSTKIQVQLKRQPAGKKLFIQIALFNAYGVSKTITKSYVA